MFFGAGKNRDIWVYLYFNQTSNLIRCNSTFQYAFSQSKMFFIRFTIINEVQLGAITNHLMSLKVIVKRRGQLVVSVMMKTQIGQGRCQESESLRNLESVSARC